MSKPTVTFAVTHKIDINRSEAWVRLEVSRETHDNETIDEAADRLVEYTSERIIEACAQVAETVIKAEEGQR